MMKRLNLVAEAMRGYDAMDWFAWGSTVTICLALAYILIYAFINHLV